jgi:hypothetical protein
MSQNNVQEEDASSVGDESLPSPIPSTSSRRVQELTDFIAGCVLSMDRALNSSRILEVAYLSAQEQQGQRDDGKRATLARDDADRLDTPARLKDALE